MIHDFYAGAAAASDSPSCSAAAGALTPSRRQLLSWMGAASLMPSWMGVAHAAPAVVERLSAASRARIDAAAARTMAAGSPGMAVGVSRAGRTLFARGYGAASLEHPAPMTPETVYMLASVTKQFTAAAVLLLVDDGRIALDDRLSKYVPELPQAAEVSIYQLLVQSSGIRDYADDGALAHKSVPRTVQEMVTLIGGLQPGQLFAPGTRWAYSNSNYMILGLIVERVSGETLPAFFRRRLFDPAGLTATAFDDPRDVVPGRARGYRRARGTPSGFANADWISPTIPGPAGGLRTNITDLLRWSDALHGGRILRPATLARLTAPGTLNDGRTTKLGMPEDWQRGLNADYGMGVFINPVAGGGRRIWHSGDIDGFATWLAHYPERRLTIALMINSQSADLEKEAIEEAVIADLDQAG